MNKEKDVQLSVESRLLRRAQEESMEGAQLDCAGGRLVAVGIHLVSAVGIFRIDISLRLT